MTLLRRMAIVAGFFVVVAPIVLAVSFRYQWTSTERFPSQPIPQYFVVSALGELPTSGTREGDLGYVKSGGGLYQRGVSSWAAVSGGGGAPTTSEYWLNTADGSLPNAKVLGTAAGTINGLCVGFACTPAASEIQLGNTAFRLRYNSGDPLIEYDTNDFVRYTRASNFWEWYIASAQRMKLSAAGVEIPDGLIVGFNGTPVADTVALGDANFRLDTSAGGGGAFAAPGLVFDTGGDLFVFNRSTNAFVWQIAGTNEMLLTASGLTLNDPLAFGQGGTGLASAADDTVMVSSGTAWVAKALSDCTGTGKAVTYNATSNTFGCNTTSGTSIIQVMSTDQSTSSTGYQTVTQLSFGTAASTQYIFTCAIDFITSSTAESISLAISGPTMSGAYSYGVITPTGATTTEHVAFTVNDGAHTPGTSSGATRTQARIFGVVSIASGGGNTLVRFHSEGASVTIKAGSWCQFTST